MRIALLAVLATSTAYGEDTATAVSSEQDYAALRARLHENVPELRIDAIRATPIAHLFAVVSGDSSVLYVDESGQYVLNGHLFEAKDKFDLTDELLADIARIDPKQLPTADAFTEVRGNGRRQLYVFSDPDCPFCKKLESELPELHNVTIHVFLYPLTSLHPNARTNAIAVWCSADRSKAWQDKMLRDVLPSAQDCPNPVDRNVALGSKLGFAGTPTLIFPDGKVVSGVIPTASIERLLGPGS
jgi:thiol:disulfide interchange protein DsbC